MPRPRHAAIRISSHMNMTIPDSLSTHVALDPYIIDWTGDDLFPPPVEMTEAGEGVFHVECILDHRRLEGDTMCEYLVKWFGYPVSDATWEPAAHLEGCKEELERFILSAHD